MSLLRFQTLATMAYMKSFLMVFNLIFWLSGIILVIIGIWMEVDLHKYTEMSTKFNNIIPYALIVIGTLIVLTGSFACCWTLRGQPVLLYIYGVILAVIFVLELGCTVSVYSYRWKLMEGFDQGITKAMSSYYNETARIALDLDNMQQTMQCCGNHNSTDWLDIEPQKIPESCCVKQNCEVDDESQIFQKGCYEQIDQFFNTHIKTVAVIATIVVICPLMGLLLSCSLARLLNKVKYEQMN